MKNKLTVDFGFRKIWKRKKKIQNTKNRKQKKTKTKTKTKVGGMGWRDLKDWSSDSAAVNFHKKIPTHSTDCASVNEDIILTPLFRSHFGIDYPKAIVL